jgi:hypothetical protein
MVYVVIAVLVITFGTVQFTVGWYFANFVRSRDDERLVLEAETRWDARTQEALMAEREDADRRFENRLAEERDRWLSEAGQDTVRRIAVEREEAKTLVERERIAQLEAEAERASRPPVAPQRDGSPTIIVSSGGTRPDYPPRMWERDADGLSATVLGPEARLACDATVQQVKLHPGAANDSRFIDRLVRDHLQDKGTEEVPETD